MFDIILPRWVYWKMYLIVLHSQCVLRHLIDFVQVGYLSVFHTFTVGATCNGTNLVGKDGSSWIAANDTYRVSACLAGWILIRDQSATGSPELDQCYKCPGVPYPGFYSMLPAAFPGALYFTKNSRCYQFCHPSF